MNDEDLMYATTVGVIWVLWLIGGLICVGRPRTHRLGLWVLGSGALAGLAVAIGRMA